MPNVPATVSENGLRAQVQELSIEVAVLKARVEEKEEALRLQAREYERRLSELNHAHKLAEETLARYGATYLTIDRFDRFYNDEHIIWRRSVDDRLSTDKSSKSTYVSILAMVLVILSVGFQAWDAVMGVK